MDQTLIYFLIGCICWAALLYYLFVMRQAPDPGAGGKAGFVILTALLIPLLGVALWNQNESEDRLKELGFTAFHGFENTVGVAAGSGPEPTWLFALSTPPNAVLDFYRRPQNHSGWTLAAETSSSLELERGAWKMRLQVSDGNAAFLLSGPEDAMPNQATNPTGPQR